MIQQQRQPDVQTLESDELSRLLRRRYVPVGREHPEVIRTPDHLLPDRCQVIDRIISSHGHYPQPELDIVYGSAFFHSLIPTTGKLYINCIFYDCDFSEPAGYCEFFDNNIEGLKSWKRLFSHALTNRLPFAGNVEIPLAEDKH